MCEHMHMNTHLNTHTDTHTHTDVYESCIQTWITKGKNEEASAHLLWLGHQNAWHLAAQRETGRLSRVVPTLNRAPQHLNSWLLTHPLHCKSASGDLSPFEANSEAAPCVTERKLWHGPGCVFQLTLTGSPFQEHHLKNRGEDFHNFSSCINFCLCKTNTSEMRKRRKEKKRKKSGAKLTATWC